MTQSTSTPAQLAAGLVTTSATPTIWPPHSPKT
jgi:hypothetical protein